MPNRFVEKNGRTVEMLTRVPVNRGSLLKGIDSLLKTIETSENAVMIPTLLKDKVRVDACELLFVAKILKASILGHSDLVEFYMNHIGQTSSALQQTGEPASPSIRLQSPMASPLLTHAISNHQREQEKQQQALTAAGPATNGAQGSSQGSSSVSSMSTCSTSSSSMSSSQAATATPNGARSSSGSASWITAQQSLAGNGSDNSLSSSASLLSSAASGETATPASCADQAKRKLAAGAPTNLSPSLATPDETQEAHEALLATANKPLMGRQAQPPSLLQLTTTNNHINSMSDMLQGAQQLSPSLEQLTGQLAALQQQTCALSSAQHQAVANANTNTANGTFEGLSISTTPAHAALQLDQLTSTASTPAANGTAAGAAATPPAGRHELRSSRSAGCLFRANSGATSPRTPNQTTPSTPFPQAETLDGGAANGLVGEPGSLVKLLLQVEQLKTSIAHCTTLLESVVELYKKSIDNLA